MNTVRELLRREGRDVASVAREAGLSRQAVYRMLDPAWDPFSAGFRAVARALGVDPVALLVEGSDAGLGQATATLREAARGDARAFELLPSLVTPVSAARLAVAAASEPEQRVLVAAALVAQAIRPHDTLGAWIEGQMPTLSPTAAFFFGATWMSPERLVAATPEPMKRARVFGAYSLDDFSRHLR